MQRRSFPLLVVLLAGCGSSRPPLPPNPTTIEPTYVGEPVAPTVAPPTCRHGVQPAADGLIGNFEGSGDAEFGGRSPTWWLSAAEHASITVPGKSFAESDGGPPGSKKAVHFAGKTAHEDAWGATVAVNFLPDGFYDASKYAGIAFKIKSARPNLNVRLKLPDAASHPDGGQCQKECWNSFGKELIVGPAWLAISLMWSDLAQQPDWGVPRPAAITPSKLKDIEWTVYPGVDFDFWVDEVHFLECK